MKIGEWTRTALFFASIILLTLFGVSLGFSEAFGCAYSKVEVFRTEREYIEFKEDLADLPIRNLDIEILSSEPPIIVGYTITLPKGIKFPRSTEKSRIQKLEEVAWIFGIVGGTTLALAILLPRKGEDVG